MTFSAFSNKRILQLRNDNLKYILGAFHSAQNSGNFDWKSNGTNHFGSVRPEYLGLPLKVAHFDRSSISVARTEMSLSMTKLSSPVPLFCILLTRTITKRAMGWVGSVQPECTVLMGTWNFRNFKPELLLNGKRPINQCPIIMSDHR